MTTGERISYSDMLHARALFYGRAGFTTPAGQQFVIVPFEEQHPCKDCWLRPWKVEQYPVGFLYTLNGSFISGEQAAFVIEMQSGERRESSPESLHTSLH